MIFSRKKESEAKNLIKEHIVLVHETLIALKAMLRAFLDKDESYKDLSYEVHKKEHAADGKRRETEEKLYSGAFMPTYREDYCQLLEAMDRIANRAETVADMVAQQMPEIPDDIKEDFAKLSETVIENFTPLLEVIDAMDKSYDLVKKLEIIIEEKEQEADRIEWNMIKKIFEKKDMELAKKMHTRDLITLLSSVADRIEDAGDRIQLIILKRIA